MVGAIKFQSKKCLEEITEAYKYFPPALIRITKNIGDDHQYRGSKGKRRGAERHISMEKNREQESGALFEKVYVDIIFHSETRKQPMLFVMVGPYAAFIENMKDRSASHAKVALLKILNHCDFLVRSRGLKMHDGTTGMLKIKHYVCDREFTTWE